MNNLTVERTAKDAILAQTLLNLKVKQAKVKENFDRDLGETWEEAEEKLKAMRSDPIAFTRYVYGYEPERHHKLILELLTKSSTGQARQNKVLIIAPPNSAKSTYTSFIHPTFYLGNHFDHSLLFLTSSDRMANQFGGAVRGTFEANEKYKAVFPEKECEPNLKRGWSNDAAYLKGAPLNKKDPSHRAVGWNTKIVGARCHGMIIDDPLDQEQSQSELSQRVAKDYFSMTLKPRLHLPPEYNGWIHAVMTRWHEDDLASYFIELAEKDSSWLIVNIPVRAYEIRPDQPKAYPPDPLGREPGEILWEGHYTKEELEAEEDTLGTAKFNCVYQGDPTGLGGEVFSSGALFRDLPADFFHAGNGSISFFDKLPKVQAWDLAFSERDSACFTVCITAAIDSRMNLYIVDVDRRHLSTIETEHHIVNKALEYHPIVVGIEETAYRHTITRDIARKVKQKIMLNIHLQTQTQDKVARARLPASWVESSKVFVDKYAPWYSAFLLECLGFPNTKFKDQVDAFSLLAEMVSLISMSRLSKPTKAKWATH